VLKFPTRAFKENRLVLSREELEEKSIECNAVGKSCEVGLYSFAEWHNSDPIIESVIIDKVVLKGDSQVLMKIGDKKFEEGTESVLLFDGQDHLLLIDEPKDSVEELEQEMYPDVVVIKDVYKKITLPNFLNLKSGQMSKVIKKWKRDA